jgi:hypothetical protein
MEVHGSAGLAGRRYPRRAAPATFRLHVRLEGTFPPVWRRVDVASDLRLDDLHDVWQVTFGWRDYHLYRFTTGPEMDPGVAFVCAADLAEAWEGEDDLPTWDVQVDELSAVVGEAVQPVLLTATNLSSGPTLDEAIRRVATYRSVGLAPLVDVRDGLSEPTQPGWSTWRTRQNLTDRLPATFMDVVNAVIAFGDLGIAGTARTPTWQPDLAAWQPEEG